jgi:acyl-CoA thioesterase-1
MKNAKYILISVAILLTAMFALWYVFLRNDNVKTVVENNVKPASYTIVAFGDSLTAGYGLPLYESYPAQLEERLVKSGLNVKVVNAGVSGETSKGNNERAEFIRNTNPDMIIWGIGGNDALRALPISELMDNMESTIKILQSGENPPKLVMLQMQAPLNAGIEYKKVFDSIYIELSQKYNVKLVPFLVSDVFLNPALMLQDRIHPNKAGYAKLIEDNLFDLVVSDMK